MDDSDLRDLLVGMLGELRTKLEAEGDPLAALGLSLFAVGDEPASTLQVSALVGDIAAVGMFAPDWPFQLTADLLEGPTSTLGAGAEESLN